jgi:hypothetical protein
LTDHWAQLTDHCAQLTDHCAQLTACAPAVITVVSYDTLWYNPPFFPNQRIKYIQTIRITQFAWMGDKTN